MNKAIAKVIVVITVFMIFVTGTPQASAAAFDGSNIASSYVMLIDADTGAVLYEKNADKKCAPASTTKLLTAVIALEKLSLDQQITVPAEAQTSGTSMGLKPGYVVTVETLLYGMLMCSGNDAAVTLAIAISGSVEAFATVMNEKAQELGMTNSHFVTASGLDNDEHYVTVRDMSRLARYAYTFEEIRKIASIPTYTCTTVDKTISFPMESTNLLIYTPFNGSETTAPPVSYEYEYATGLKTGSTSSAKSCLVASAEKDGRKLIALIFKDPTSNGAERWTLAKALFEYGFSNYRNVALSDLAGTQLEINVIGGAIVGGEAMKLKCSPVASDGAAYITLENGINAEDIEYHVTPYENVEAPVEEGQVVGTVELYLNGTLLLSGNLAATDGIMTQEEYSKLTGSAVGTVDPTKLNGSIKEVISKYIWLWLLIPAAGITFFIVRAVRVDRRRMRRYGRLSGVRRGRRPRVGVNYSSIRRQQPQYVRSTPRKRY